MVYLNFWISDRIYTHKTMTNNLSRHIIRKKSKSTIEFFPRFFIFFRTFRQLKLMEKVKMEELTIKLTAIHIKTDSSAYFWPLRCCRMICCEQIWPQRTHTRLKRPKIVRDLSSVFRKNLHKCHETCFFKKSNGWNVLKTVKIKPL